MFMFRIGSMHFGLCRACDALDHAAKQACFAPHDLVSSEAQFGRLKSWTSGGAEPSHDLASWVAEVSNDGSRGNLPHPCGKHMWAETVSRFGWV